MAKDKRLTVRLTAREGAVIRRAVECEGTDLATFTRKATLAHAHHVLADRVLFKLDDAAWAQFVEILDRPVSDNPGLQRLFSEPSA